MCLFVFWVCLCSLVGLGSEGMQTHRLASGKKGDFWGGTALEEETPALLDGLWSEPGLVGSGERERERKGEKHIFLNIKAVYQLELTHGTTINAKLFRF